MKKIVFISDTHNHRFKLPQGDILIHCGDGTIAGTRPEMVTLLSWLSDESEEKDNFRDGVFFVAGNHDWMCQKNPNNWKELLKSFPAVNYLQDEMAVIDGLKIYGSPWSTMFYNWAFMEEDKDLEKHWNKIPNDIDILITHGPAYDIGDKNEKGNKCGSTTLRKRIEEIKPKIHAFGHIHNDAGIHNIIPNVLSINASSCNERYDPVNPPIIVEV